MAEYIVLRRAPGLVAGGDLESFGFSASAEITPLVDVHDLEPNEAVDINRDPHVLAVARSMPTKLVEPLSGGAQTEWGIAAVGADQSQLTGIGVTVAVLDTGIDGTHPAFVGVNLVEQDFTATGNGDQHGHGTHCAGTIFGRDVNGVRIGVARGVDHTMIGKVLDNNGLGNSQAVFRAIQWAISGGANIISMSLGFDFPGLVLRLTQNNWPADLATSNALEAYRANLRMFDALMAMAKAGAPFNTDPVVIAAAGNESRRQVNPNYRIAASLPAASYDVVSVAAVQEATVGTYAVADFSNSMPVLAGPGVDILSASLGGGLTSLSGTSMACPHVAGVAALWWEFLVSQNQGAGGTNVQTKLRASCRTNVFQPLDQADVGLGLVTSP